MDDTEIVIKEFVTESKDALDQFERDLVDLKRIRSRDSFSTRYFAQFTRSKGLPAYLASRNLWAFRTLAKTCSGYCGMATSHFPRRSRLLCLQCPMRFAGYCTQCAIPATREMPIIR